MRRRWTFVAVLAVLTLMPIAAQARGRGSRSGKVYGAGGLMYDTNSPAWKAAGGNINVYQQMMAQKAMMAQQKVMMAQQKVMMQQQAKQQQAFQKWYKDQKAKKDKGQPTDPSFDRYNKMVDQQNEMMLKQAQSFRSPAQRTSAKRSKSKSKTSVKPKSEPKSESK
ncbi:MAG: hypothetical protein ABI353_02040 [Isosphaeraceae bacterium]